jgi:hypothetical protein
MCDKCDRWQHQICALYNVKRDELGEAEYTCPKCYVLEIERGLRMPLPQSAVLGAKDLPRTVLSDHIEGRLFKRLREERQERATRDGKSFDEVSASSEFTKINLVCFSFPCLRCLVLSWFHFFKSKICGFYTIFVNCYFYLTKR